MSVNLDEAKRKIEDSLRYHRALVNRELHDVSERQFSSDGQDFNTSLTMKILQIQLTLMDRYIDDEGAIESAIYYFSGYDSSPTEIESTLQSIEAELLVLQDKLTSENDDVLKLVEQQVSRKIDQVAELKSQLVDLNYNGWIQNDNVCFNCLESVQQHIRNVRHQVVRAYEKHIEPDLALLRKNVLDAMRTLEKELAEELKSSSRLKDIRAVIVLLETGESSWSKEKWLELKYLCTQGVSNLKNELYRFFPTIDATAKKLGSELATLQQEKIDKFGLATTGDIGYVPVNSWEH